ncbi:MAG: choice-of-anchor R domain-containing protein [Pirellula sp.]
MRVFGYAPHLSRVAALAVLVVVGFGMQVQAAVILGNLPATNDGTFTSTSTSTMKAFAFTMGTDSYKLDKVILRLRDYDDGDTPLVQIRNDVGGSDPGSTVIASFSNPATQSGLLANYTFTPTSTVTLAGSTKYWLYVGSSSGGFNFMGSSPSVPLTGMATADGIRISTNGGSSYNDSLTANSLEIHGTLDAPPVVPEPSTMAVFGIGTLVAGVARARRRRKQQA